MNEKPTLHLMGLHWDKSSMNDRILGLNSVGVVGEVARQIAGCDWIDLHSSLQEQLRDLH